MTRAPACLLPHVLVPFSESKLRHALRRAHFYLLELLAPLRTKILPRRMQVYSISVGKSGSHSLYSIFQKNYRAAHEPFAQIALDFALTRAGKTDPAATRAFLAQRDRALWLELDASPFMVTYVDDLAAALPNAKFILTLRDCYSWLNSMLNFSLKRRSTARHVRFQHLIFGQKARAFAPEERILQECGLFNLDGYLAFWARQNQRVLSAIPHNQLLVIRTHELAFSLPRIASFLDLPAGSLDATQAHRFKTGADYGILKQINASFLRHRVQQHCAPLMGEYFPEIRQLCDALP